MSNEAKSRLLTAVVFALLALSAWIFYQVAK